MNQTRAEYLMDDPREAQRLAEKVRPGEWVNKYLEPYLPMTRSILDVGCGPATIMAEVARHHPEIEVAGVDISEALLVHARRQSAQLSNATVHRGDVRALPFAMHRFDLVFCRFLLEYLADPYQAVKEMVRVCQPGGKVLLQDLDGQLVWHYPADPELHPMLEQVVEGLGRSGFDPFLGRKLFTLAYKAGLTDIVVRAEPYHLFAGRIDEHNLKLWELKLDIALPRATKVLGSREASTALKSRFLEYLLRPDTLTYSIMFTVIGTVQQPENGSLVD